MSSDATGERRRLPKNTRVAVDALQADQRELLYHGDADRAPTLQPLDDGFETRRELCNWWQAAAVRTFGHVREFFPAAEIIHDDTLTAALTAPDPTQAQRHERRQLQYAVLDACRDAYRDCESRAREWLSGQHSDDSDYTQIDPERQRHIGMRPAFSRLDAEQARALWRLWDGFDGEAAMLQWVHDLPALARFDGVLPGSLAEFLQADEHARRMLQADSELAAEYREHFAAAVVLPAFGERAARLQAAEKPRSKPSENPWNKPRSTNE